MIAGISYLNARPIFFPLIAGKVSSSHEIRLFAPSEANRKVISGEAVGGLISSAAWCAEKENLIRVPGFEIASRGPVASILLFGEIAAPRRIAVTRESRTSIELVRMLFKCETIPSDDPLAELESHETDAALLIGDSALRARACPFARLDLGSAWQEKYGVPMVYAVFAVGRSHAAEIPAIRQELSRALEWSREHLDEVIGDDYNELRGSGFDSADYLRAFDRLRADPELEEGLTLFCQMVNT